MTALAVDHLLEQVRAAGGRVLVMNDGVKVRTRAPLPDELVADLRQHKAEIMAALREATGLWGAEDWRAFYEERAAIAEHDGGQSRAEAEETAYECCVIEWMNRNPAPSEPGSCAWCGEDEGPDSIIVAFGTEDAGHAWLHSHCWADWHEHRREEAVHALAAMGTISTYQESRTLS